MQGGPNGETPIYRPPNTRTLLISNPKQRSLENPQISSISLLQAQDSGAVTKLRTFGNKIRTTFLQPTPLDYDRLGFRV